MMPKFDTYVAVFYPNASEFGPVAKFVTRTEGSTCYWEPGKEAARF